MSTNNESALNISRPESFLLKGCLLPMSLLELRSSNLTLIQEELNAKVQSAPGFFKGNPVVFSFEALENASSIDLASLKTFCNELGLISSGIKSSDETLICEAEKLGLAVFHERREKSKSAPEATPKVEKTGTSTKVSKERADTAVVESVQTTSHIPAKIIDAPVRSGQQVYAPGDMVIMSSVSAGAEILAGGNIHIYGTLRGRALAGVKGDSSARIFCMGQEAELISIAGHFMIDEDLRAASWSKSVQVFYNGNDLEVKVLGE